MPTQTTFKIDQIVWYTPKKPSLQWASGRRRITGFEGDGVKLFCGDIKLVVSKSEIVAI